MSDPAYQLDPNHPANRDKVNKYPPESARNDRHRDEVLSKDTTGYRGRVAGPQAEPTAPEEAAPRTEVERLFPDRERVAEAQHAQTLLGFLPRGFVARSLPPI